MPAVEWITIDGFKSIRSIERLHLGPINVLIGPNGSGKSNFIGAFSLLRDVRARRLQEYVSRSGGADKILHFGSKVTPKLRIHIAFGHGVNQYEITLTGTDVDTLQPSREECIEFKDGHPLTTTSLGGYGPEAWISQRDTHGLDNWTVRNVRKRLDKGWRV